MRDEYKMDLRVFKCLNKEKDLFTISLNKELGIFITHTFVDGQRNYSNFKTYKEAYDHIKKEYNKLENE